MNLAWTRLRGSPFMLWWAVGVHYIWALALFHDSKITNLVILIGTKWLTDWGLSAYLLAGLLASASSLAVIGLAAEKRINPVASFILVLPQFLLMIAGSLSDSEGVISGRINANHYDRFLLLALLGPLIWAGILHTASILDRYGPVSWRKRAISD